MWNPEVLLCAAWATFILIVCLVCPTDVLRELDFRGSGGFRWTWPKTNSKNIIKFVPHGEQTHLVPVLVSRGNRSPAVVFVQIQAGVALPLTGAASAAAAGHSWREPAAPAWLLVDVKSVFTLMVTDLFSYVRQLCVYFLSFLPLLSFSSTVWPCLFFQFV